MAAFRRKLAFFIIGWNAQGVEFMGKRRPSSSAVTARAAFGVHEDLLSRRDPWPRLARLFIESRFWSQYRAIPGHLPRRCRLALSARQGRQGRGI